MAALRGCDATPGQGQLARSPTLVPGTDQDPISPPAVGPATATGIPGARFVILPGASHGIIVHQPERVNRLLLEHLLQAETARAWTPPATVIQMKPRPYREGVGMVDALQALTRLKEGNRRFVDGAVHHSFTGPERRRELEVGQAPFAIILGCADSRVPAEMVFDQGLGDLFVIRVAGNIVAPSQVGSVEFAAGRYGSRLVVVLGHSTCGAVMATVEELNAPDGTHSRNVRSIVGRILPTVADLFEFSEHLSPEQMLNRAIRANIRASVNHLRHGSQTLEHLIETDGLRIVGAHYSLETGEVEFMDEVEAD